MIIVLTIGLEVLDAAGQRHALPAGDHEPAAGDQEIGRTPAPRRNNTTLMLLKLVPCKIKDHFNNKAARNKNQYSLQGDPSEW